MKAESELLSSEKLHRETTQKLREELVEKDEKLKHLEK